MRPYREAIEKMKAEKRDTPVAKSVLSEQREADEELCEQLGDFANWGCARLGLHKLAGVILQATTRIHALSEALQEACHERDGLLAKVPEWQPIETAPRDGSVVLAVNTKAIWPEACICEFRDGIWCLEADDGWAVRPTHWMLLPTPPGEE